MGIVNYILYIVLRLLNLYFRLIFRFLDPLILKFVGPPTHVTNHLLLFPFNAENLAGKFPRLVVKIATTYIYT